MTLETRQSWDFFFWMVLIALVGTIAIGFKYVKFIGLPIFIISIIDVWLLTINNRIAIREIKAQKDNTIKPN
jgi:hypothetical protein